MDPKEQIKNEFGEMVELFGNEKAAEYFKAGKDLVTAKSDFIKVQKTEIQRLNTEINAKNAEITALNEKLALKTTVPAVPPVNAGSQRQPPAPPAKETYEQIYARLTSGEKRMTAREATKFIITNHKAEYDAFIESKQRK